MEVLNCICIWINKNHIFHVNKKHNQNKEYWYQLCFSNCVKSILVRLLLLSVCLQNKLKQFINYSIVEMEKEEKEESSNRYLND